MALPTTPVVADFIGYIRLSYDTYSASDMQGMIDQLWPDMLRDFIGQEAFAWIEDNALTAEWDLFFEGGQYTDADGVKQFTRGFTKASLYLLYFHLLRDSGWINTATGNVVNANENSTQQPQGSMEAVALSRYNLGIEWLRGLCKYVNETPYFEQFEMSIEWPEYATI